MKPTLLTAKMIPWFSCCILIGSEEKRIETFSTKCLNHSIAHVHEGVRKEQSKPLAYPGLDQVLYQLNIWFELAVKTLEGIILIFY